MRVKNGILTALAAIVVVWPFFQYPGTMFYNRYSEAWLFINPGWLLHSYVGGWSYYQHLGYPTLTELVYLSLQTLIMWGVHAVVGTQAASKIYPALIQLWLLFSFLFFARKKYPQLPYAVALLVALFFAVNPITAAAIHEGYSGMLVDYALFPWTLLLVDYASERKMPALLAVIPLLYTATSMFKFPEVAINFAGLLILRWREIVALLRGSRTSIALIVLAFCVNLYWVLPIALNAATHHALPIQADTQSEIAVTTHYSSLSNVVLGRVFGMFGADANLCSGCSYYQGAYFNIAMAFVAALAIIGLIRARRWNYLAVIIAAIVFATGYHYQDDIIGIPYQILMGLPTMQIFRAANVFSMIAFFCYGVGLLNFFAMLRGAVAPQRWTWGAAVAVAFAGLPLFTGSILEHGTPPQATFFVRIPHAYAAARSALPHTSDGVTLLLPNQGFAAYKWGAAVQDFLPAYVGRPSISNWYWPQPGADTQRVLDLVSHLRTPRLNVIGAMAAMRVDSVLIHDDVIGAHRVNAERYGRPIFLDRGVSVVLPPLAPVPMYETAQSALQSPADSAAAVAGWTGAITSTVPDAVNCNGVPFALAPFKVSRDIAFFHNTPHCSQALTMTLLSRTAMRPPAVIVRRGRYRVTLVMHAAGRLRWQTTARVPRGATIVVRDPAAEVLEFAEARSAQPTQAQALDLHLTLGAWGWAHVPVDARVLVINQSSDPSWQTLVWTNGRAHVMRKFVANGYANGWFVPAGANVLVLNLAQIAFLLGCALSLAALAVGALLAAVSVQRYSVRAEFAAQD